MRIRLFRKEDAIKVSYIIKRSLIEVNSIDYPKKVIQFLCDAHSPEMLIENSQKKQIFVAVEKNDIIGTASLDENWIGGMFVDPKVHKKGIGTRLITFLEKRARKNGYKFVQLGASLTAYEFYQKKGYKKVKKRHNKNIGTVILMRKHL